MYNSRTDSTITIYEAYIICALKRPSGDYPFNSEMILLALNGMIENEEIDLAVDLFNEYNLSELGFTLGF